VRRIGAISAVLMGVASTVLVLWPAAAQVKPPADFAFPPGKDDPGVVTFSHEKHNAAGDKCTDCHVKIFKLKKGGSGEINMTNIRAGKQCGMCHNGTKEVEGKIIFRATDEANCERCHKKAAQ